MKNNNQFGKRNMRPLSFNIKIIVFYEAIEDKETLNYIQRQCNTVTCRYSIFPILLESVESIDSKFIKKNIRKYAIGYKKGFDKVFVIKKDQEEIGEYTVVDSITCFENLFTEMQQNSF
jgi:hypothetical protein